jgi:hypothetical protein
MAGLRERIRGALLGCFAGDAMGRPFEGASPTDGRPYPINGDGGVEVDVISGIILGGCPHPAPLLDEDPPEVIDLTRLELLAGDAPTYPPGGGGGAGGPAPRPPA